MIFNCLISNTLEDTNNNNNNNNNNDNSVNYEQ